MFWVAIGYALTYFVPVTPVISAWTNNLSHLFALPAIFDFPRALSMTVLVTAGASVLFHAADTFGYEGDWLRRLDHGLSMYLVFLTIAKVWYHTVPPVTKVLLIVSGVLPAALLTKPRVYPPMAVFALLLATIVYYTLYTTYRVLPRVIHKVYLLFVLALLIRMLPTTTDNRGHVHSIWHVLAFTAVYYAIQYTKVKQGKDKEFPCKWIFMVFGLYMVLFVTYLSYNPAYVMDVGTNETCGTLHCGPCGACSTQHDYDVYVNTSQTLTGDARTCALWGLFGGDEQGCLEQTGLSANCTKCWVQNMGCTKRHCLFPCMWELYPRGRCLECDEYHCADEFLQCAGMSRRRAGVVSDIRRSDTEMCQLGSP